MRAKGSFRWPNVFVAAKAVAAIGLLIAAGGCVDVIPPDDGGTTDTGNSGVTGKFVGAETCAQCHGNKHADWSGTDHAGALEALENIGQGENAECLACHTVGFGQEGGFVSRATTNALAGVQCENCHGPGRDHVDAAQADATDPAVLPEVNLSAALCGACHTDPHHPTFDEWQLSKHATALEGLRSNAFAQDRCLECHSFDYRHALEEQEEGKVVELPTVETAQFSLECATCHSPHGGVQQEHLLRLPIANLCGQCHTVEEATIGDTPHHPQFEMATGIGAFDADGGPLSAAFTPHAELFQEGDIACAQCHVASHEVDEPSEEIPNVTGHTFNPFDEDITEISPEHQAGQFDGCLRCHDANGAEDRKTRVQDDISGRLATLAAVFDSASDSFIDPEALTEDNLAKWNTAKFNYQFVDADGSKGVHNSFYAREALGVAEDLIAELQGE